MLFRSALFIRKKQNIKNNTYQSAFVFGIKPKSIPQQIAWAISLGWELLLSVLKMFVINFIIRKTPFIKLGYLTEKSEKYPIFTELF